MRGGTRYDILSEQVRSTEIGELTPSPGGYFVEGKETLDPRLFDGDHLKPEVRQSLLGMLYGYWNQKYADPEAWSTVWIAGSQITPQWREEGDLDILIGIEMPRLIQTNPEFRGFPEKTVANHLTRELKADVWPHTANWRDQFEVTFYINPGTRSDIRNINPYAAYNLSTDEWTVKPPDMPEDWGPEAVPESWQRSLEAEINRVKTLWTRYQQISNEIDGLSPPSPRYVNALHKMRLVVDEARDLWLDIYRDRQKAFQGQAGVKGEGFFDYYNYRWQAHKSAGTVKFLVSLSKISQEVHEKAAEERYGSVPSADVLTPGTLPRGYRSVRL